MDIPSISLDDLVNFHRAHIGAFGSAATRELTRLFEYDSGPEEIEHEEVEEEDPIYYYSDGVERTLTDDQIAFFRASELRELSKTSGREKSEAGSELVNPDSIKKSVAETRPYLASLAGPQHKLNVNQQFGNYNLDILYYENELDNIFEANCKKIGVRNYFPILPLRN